jgi:hypothetical protein
MFEGDSYCYTRCHEDLKSHEVMFLLGNCIRSFKCSPNNIIFCVRTSHYWVRSFCTQLSIVGKISGFEYTVVLTCIE